MRPLHAFALGLLALGVAACSAVRVETDYDHSVHFDAMKTFAFLPPPRRANEPAPAPDDSMLDNSIVRERIRAAIVHELREKGYHLVDRNQNPDVLVAYYLSSRPVTEVVPDYDWGYGWGFGYGPWYYGYEFGPVAPGPSLDYRTYREGTLLIDLVDPRDRRLIWRGRGDRDVHDDTQLVSRKRIEHAVERILDDFPPETD